jgi:all-trans-nonaprenyl-diphosphate synthase
MLLELSSVIAWFVGGFIIAWISVRIRSRIRAYNELVNLKLSLTEFVKTDPIIASLYPPQYLLGGQADLVDESVTPLPASSWESVSDPDFQLVKSALHERVEKFAESFESDSGARPAFAAALRYTLYKSGKMVRSRLAVMLGRFLGVADMEKVIQIAQIVELEHTASLLHDDVVDEADTRRGIPSHRKMFGDRTAVLTGDNLISLLVDVLAEVDDMRVTTLVAESIESLVVGELLQLVDGTSVVGVGRGLIGGYERLDEGLQSRIEKYLRKSYFKTASLFACLAQSVAGKQVDSAGRFGFYFGLAFQIVDDILDFDKKSELGKPCCGADLRNGTVTLPVLLACADMKSLSTDQCRTLRKMVERRFRESGDPESGLDIVMQSDGIERSRRVVSACFKRCRDELNRMRTEETDPKFHQALLSLLEFYESRTS